MPDQKISADPLLAAPSAQTAFPAIDPGTDATQNYRVDRAGLLALLNSVPITDVLVAASANQTVGAAHNGATFILGGAGATLTFDATARGDGFAFSVINDTGAAWIVPTFNGGTKRYDQGAAHTRVAAGGTAGFETYTRGGVRYVNITGSTVA